MNAKLRGVLIGQQCVKLWSYWLYLLRRVQSYWGTVTPAWGWSPGQSLEPGILGKTKRVKLDTSCKKRHEECENLSTWLLEQEHSLWRCVYRERVCPLYRAPALTWHAVTAARIPKPQVLKNTHTQVQNHNLSHTLLQPLAHTHTQMETHADLSALCAEGRLVGECVSWRMCDDAHATGKRSSTRGQGELSLTSPGHTSTHRACCGQRIWTIRPPTRTTHERVSDDFHFVVALLYKVNETSTCVHLDKKEVSERMRRTLSVGTQACPAWLSVGNGGAVSTPAASKTPNAFSASLWMPKDHTHTRTTAQCCVLGLPPHVCNTRIF